MIASILNAAARIPAGIADALRAGRLDPEAQLVMASARAERRRAMVRRDLVRELDGLRDARAKLTVRAKLGLTARSRARAEELVKSADATIVDLERQLRILEVREQADAAAADRPDLPVTAAVPVFDQLPEDERLAELTSWLTDRLDAERRARETLATAEREAADPTIVPPASFKTEP